MNFERCAVLCRPGLFLVFPTFPLDSLQPHTNEALYQCGECYEDCGSMQCNTTPLTQHQQGQAPSCNCSKTLDRSSGGQVTGSNTSPEQGSSSQHNCMARYQNTPPRTSPEHLYNELDPRFLSGMFCICKFLFFFTQMWFLLKFSRRICWT